MSAAAAVTESAASRGAAAGVPALAEPAELATFHRKLQTLELEDIYELIAAHLAKDPFSVADAAQISVLKQYPDGERVVVEMIS
eukprot:SAG11_NODE_914_length_6565_cov_8.318126_3_plen_84_part_00